MTMTADPPLRQNLDPLTVRVYCTGRRKDGTLCNHLLFKGVIGREGKIEFPCPKCGRLAIFE